MWTLTITIISIYNKLAHGNEHYSTKICIHDKYNVCIMYIFSRKVISDLCCNFFPLLLYQIMSEALLAIYSPHTNLIWQLNGPM